MALHVSPVQTIPEALAIAEVRNTGIEFMTHNGELITPEAQETWFTQAYQLAKSNGQTHAFIGREASTPVAYGLVNHLDGDYWLTGVVVPEAQGKGYGRILFQHLGNFTLNALSADRVLLDVLNTNERAKKLYTSLGYKAISFDRRTTVMELQR